MVAKSNSLWGLVWGQPHVDPCDLAGAVQEEAARYPEDFRTRLLIRDSIEALRLHWGGERVQSWLQGSPTGRTIESICQEDLGPTGFPTLRERLMEKVDPEVVKQLFREIGSRLHTPTRMMIGGSIALILSGLLARATEDIDVVDEVPRELRGQHALLQDLRKRYGLLVTHFQSHYLPSGWEKRVHYLDTFGGLGVYLVDAHDIFLSKLFSARPKDLDDLRTLVTCLDKHAIVERLQAAAASLLAAEDLRKRAQQNWYILFGEDLPA
jgi:hypothetical protein